MSKAQTTPQRTLGHGVSIEFDSGVPATHRHAIRAIAKRFSEDGGIDGRRADVTKVVSSDRTDATYVHLDIKETDEIGDSVVTTYDVRMALMQFDIDWRMNVFVDGDVTIHLDV